MSDFVQQVAHHIAEDPQLSVSRYILWASNRGGNSDYNEECPANASLHGQAALVTAARSRKYPRSAEVQQQKKTLGTMILWWRCKI